MSRTVHKPDDEEMEERVEFMSKLMALDLRKGHLRREFQKQYGPVSHQTLSRYESRARARNLESLNRPKPEWVSESIEYYREIAQDPATEPRDRIKARERIDKLLGLEAPARTEHSGVDGGPIQIEQLIAASELTAIDVERALLQVVNVPDSEDV